jgi:hypothetical protein
MVEGLVAYDFTLHLRVRDHIAWCWRWVGMAFRHFLLGSHNFMVTALGSWGSVATLHNVGGELGWPLDTFFWAITISWSRLLAHVWSGPSTHTPFVCRLWAGKPFPGHPHGPNNHLSHLNWDFTRGGKQSGEGTWIVVHGFPSPPWTWAVGKGGAGLPTWQRGGATWQPQSGLLGASWSWANEGPPSVREGAKRGGGRCFEVCLLGSSRVASAL